MRHGIIEETRCTKGAVWFPGSSRRLRKVAQTIIYASPPPETCVRLLCHSSVRRAVRRSARKACPLLMLKSRGCATRRARRTRNSHGPPSMAALACRSMLLRCSAPRKLLARLVSAHADGVMRRPQRIIMIVDLGWERAASYIAKPRRCELKDAIQNANLMKCFGRSATGMSSRSP